MYLKERYVEIKRKQEEYEIEERRVDKDKCDRGEKPQEAERFFNLKGMGGIKKSYTERQRGDERSRQERREEANSSNKFEEEDSRR